VLTAEADWRISAMRAAYAVGFVIRERMIMRRACAEVFEPAMLRFISAISLVESFVRTWI
jgi:hypothetical protein